MLAADFARLNEQHAVHNVTSDVAMRKGVCPGFCFSPAFELATRIRERCLNDEVLLQGYFPMCVAVAHKDGGEMV